MNWSWLTFWRKPTSKPRRTYARVTCPVCGLDVATSALSPKRHTCVRKDGAK